MGQGLHAEVKETCGFIQEVMVDLDEEAEFTAQHLPTIKASLAATITEVMAPLKQTDARQYKELKMLLGLCNN